VSLVQRWRVGGSGTELSLSLNVSSFFGGVVMNGGVVVVVVEVVVSSISGQNRK